MRSHAVKQKKDVAVNRLTSLLSFTVCLFGASATVQPSQFGLASDGYQTRIYSVTQSNNNASSHAIIHLVLRNVNHSPIALADVSGNTALRVVDAQGKVYPRTCVDVITTNAVPTTPVPRIPNLAGGEEREASPIDLYCWTREPGSYLVTATTYLYLEGTVGKLGVNPVATVVSNTLTVDVP
jgi:hypothetical protein